ncbi:MAG: imelysin family protein [Microthrixaceae bacterium]
MIEPTMATDRRGEPSRTRTPRWYIGVAALAAAALVAGACSSDDDASTDTTTADGGSSSPAAELTAEAAEPVATHYADGVYASYQTSLASATELKTAIADFTENPTEETLQAAKDQWIAARDDYGPTEAFRFYDGPIDDPDDGPEGQINAWPMDEAYVDYVEGDPEAGIINDPAGYPEITTEVLVSANEEGGETNISTGWHAIEFLLWGQDLSETGPGERPLTDYTTSPVAERRATYLNLLADLLVSDLTSVADQWSPDGADNYRSEFLADPVQAVSDMFRGIGALTVGELSGERIAVALETADQEDEHSCFSDNTNADVHNNALGIQMVYLGTYPGITEGPGLNSLVEASDAELDRQLTDQMEATVAMTADYPTTFDQMLVGDNAPLEDTVTALETQGELIAEAANSLGITVDTGI